MVKKKKNNIVDNKKLTKELGLYVEEFNKLNPNHVKKSNIEPIRPKVSEYLGKAILDMANHLATKPNFSGYTWLSDMISDGYINCLAYMHNFDLEKTNGHAYISMILWRSYVTRIKRENNNSKIKNKYMENLDNTTIYHVQENDDTDYSNRYVETLQKLAIENSGHKGTAETYAPPVRKKKSSSNNTLEGFI